MRFLNLLGPLFEMQILERNLIRNWGQSTIPNSAFLAACLIKLEDKSDLPFLKLGNSDDVIVGDHHHHFVPLNFAPPAAATLMDGLRPVNDVVDLYHFFRDMEHVVIDFGHVVFEAHDPVLDALVLDAITTSNPARSSRSRVSSGRDKVRNPFRMRVRASPPSPSRPPARWPGNRWKTSTSASTRRTPWTITTDRNGGRERFRSLRSQRGPEPPRSRLPQRFHHAFVDFVPER